MMRLEHLLMQYDGSHLLDDTGRRLQLGEGYILELPEHTEKEFICVPTKLLQQADVSARNTRDGNTWIIVTRSQAQQYRSYQDALRTAEDGVINFVISLGDGVD